jgi:exopolyphosphatase/guanosine-5'-triphosphate,3'-diphosphate pyrophosphatase
MAEAQTDQLAAVDLGSNSFHMLIARVRGGQLEVIDRMRERVQLAAGFDEHTNLTAEAQARGLAVLQRFGQRLAALESVHVRAVGTNTLRKAKNARQFIAAAQRALGHPIEVISGTEEARIIYLGVAHSLSDDSGRRLVVDIGGGSTECIIGERFEPRRVESLHIGCVSHTLLFFSDDKLRREQFRDAVTAARVELETFEREFKRTGWVSAVGSSGTILAIDQILRANGWSADGITRPGLRQLREAMIACGRIGKLALPGLSADRTSVLPGGVAILLGCFKSLKIDRMTVSTGALREGLLYDTIGRNTHEDVRVRTIDAMIERHRIDRGQASRVEATALHCLDRVAVPWSLHDPEDRFMLVAAARLHEIGLTLSYSGHHNHGAYIVANADMAGFSRDRQRLLAELIRAHRRRLRHTTLAELRALGGDGAVRLAVLLRIAVTLNRNRDPQPLPTFDLTAAAATLELRFPDGWLEAHPSTRADLQIEQEFLAAAGFNLSFA